MFLHFTNISHCNTIFSFFAHSNHVHVPPFFFLFFNAPKTPCVCLLSRVVVFIVSTSCLSFRVVLLLSWRSLVLHRITKTQERKERKKEKNHDRCQSYSWVCTVRIKATLVYITTSLEITRWVFSSPVPAPKSFTYIHSSNTESVWVLLSPVLQRNVRKPQTRRQTLKRSDLLQGLKAYQMVVASSSQKGMETFETAAVSYRNNPTCFAAVHALDGLTSASCCL